MVIRSIAIEEETLKKIHEVANERKTSVNALLQEQIEYFVNVASFSKNVGLIHISYPNFLLILNSINTGALDVSTGEGCHETFKIWAELRGLKRDLPSLLHMLKLHESMGWGTIQITQLYDGGYRVIFTHILGPVWTTFLKNWFDCGYQYMVGKTLTPDCFKIMTNGLSVTMPP